MVTTSPALLAPAPAAPWPRTVVVRFRRNRLAQFCVVGGAIFLASRAHRSPDTLELRGAELAGLTSAEATRKHLPATALEGDVAERALEDELLYREGVKLGFDKSDAIVRQRVIQKTLFLAEELAGASEPPTESELRSFYEATRAEWQRPERWRLFQVFTHERAAAESLAQQGRAGVSLAGSGEPCPLPREASATAPQLESMLGADFVASLRAAPAGAFGEPLRSALGWHVVRVEGHVPGGPSSFDEVRGQLPGVFVARRRQAAVASYLDRALREYTVTIDGRPVTALHPSGRMALRSAGSAED